MNFQIRGNAALYYSASALQMLPAPPTLASPDGPSTIELTNIRQASSDATLYQYLHPSQ